MSTATTHHAHDFLDLVRSRSDGWSAPEIEEAAKQTFGTDASYYTCSASGLSFEQLLEFLYTRGKIAVENDRIFIGGNACRH